MDLHGGVLRDSTLLFKMHLLLLVMTGSFVGMAAAAETWCDPETQYLIDGECCIKCQPGTSMSSDSPCLEPRCEPCGEDEYQDKYTKEHKCKRQPFCDTNKNFKKPGPISTTEKYNCQCEEGYHFSSPAGITCVKYTECKPGFGAKPIGNDVDDTECEECSYGTFSNETSWNGTCHEWTKCEAGYHVEVSGTNSSDNVCAPTRGHMFIWIALVVAIVAIGGLFVLYRGCIKRKAKGYFKPEPCCQEETPQTVTEVHVPMTPEENEDDPSHELSSEGLTDKGNRVMQERGKEEIVSRQESQLDSQEDSLVSL